MTVARGNTGGSGWSHDTYAEWPAPSAEQATLRFEAGDRTDGGLALDSGSAADEQFTDDPTTLAGDLAGAEESPHRLRYMTPPLGESVHVTGTVVPSLTLSMDGLAPLSVALVEYGQEGDIEIVTRGWTDPRNRASYREYDDPVAYKQSLRESEPVDPGEQVTVEFPLQATDHAFAEGSRIGVVVYASDREFTLHPPSDVEATVDLGESSVSFPVGGGTDALAAAFEGGGAGASDGEASGDDGLPGFGVGSALAALGGAGYALRRRVGSDRRSE